MAPKTFFWGPHVCTRIWVRALIGLYDRIDDDDNWHFVCSQGHKYVFEMEDAEKEKQKNNAHH